MKQVICDSLNRVRTTQIIRALAISISDRVGSPLVFMGARAMGIEELTQGKDCC